MKKIATALFLTALLFALPLKSALAFGEGYIGQITIFSGNFAPRGTAFCEGQLLSIQQHPALFSILSTRYGGDGKTTFALPNLKKAEEVLGGARYIIDIEGMYPPR